MDLASITTSSAPTFLLWVYVSVLARLMPIFVLLLPLRSTVVPLRIRTLLALGSALVLTPSALTAAGPLPASNLLIGISLVGELLLGLLLGSLLMCLLLSMRIAGQTIGQLAGLNMTPSVSTDAPPIVAQLFGWLAGVLLLICDGHRYFVDGCLDSFVAHPVGSVQFQSIWFLELERALHHTFVTGLRIATPLALSLLLANVITALIARSIPQLNLLAVGFSINTLVLMTLLFVSMGSIGWLFQAELAHWIENTQRILATGS